MRLVGNWTLVSYVTEHPDGSLGKPYGDAIGRLSYDERGNMAGQVMRDIMSMGVAPSNINFINSGRGGTEVLVYVR